MSELSRDCLQCHEPFVFDPQFYEEQGWERPNRCDSCRAARRVARAAEDDAGGEWLRCQACGSPFLFSVTDEKFHADRGVTTSRNAAARAESLGACLRDPRKVDPCPHCRVLHVEQERCTRRYLPRLG
jgi:hypothetical protein